MSLTQEIPATSPIGRDTPRVDGPLKVSGKAQYTSDFHFPGLLYAVPVGGDDCQRPDSGTGYGLGRKDARCAGDLSSREYRKDLPLDSATRIFKASVKSGVRRSKTTSFGTTASISRSPWPTPSKLPEPPPMRFAQRMPRKSLTSKHIWKPTTIPTWLTRRSARGTACDSQRGDVDAAFASAPVKLDQTYVTPSETHNPLEPHATTAMWDGAMLTLYESSQGVVNLRTVLAQMFDLPNENVRVITKFVGSGFGSKLWPWTLCPLAAAAARQLGRPVRLVLPRKMMFHGVGHRPRTQQRVRIGATPEGKLISLQHDYIYQRSMLDAHHEDCGEATPFHYSVPNLRVTFGRAKRQHRRRSRYARPGRSTRHVRD